MIPVEQTRTEKGKGNCWPACIASILECPLENVPDPADDETYGGYLRRVNEWLAPQGLRLRQFSFYRTDDKPPGYAILGADSPRGGSHAVVILDGEIVWDPHPQREMGVGSWREYGQFVCLDPARMRKDGWR